MGLLIKSDASLVVFTDDEGLVMRCPHCNQIVFKGKSMIILPTRHSKLLLARDKPAICCNRRFQIPRVFRTDREAVKALLRAQTFFDLGKPLNFMGFVFSGERSALFFNFKFC